MSRVSYSGVGRACIYASILIHALGFIGFDDTFIDEQSRQNAVRAMLIMALIFYCIAALFSSAGHSGDSVGSIVTAGGIAIFGAIFSLIGVAIYGDEHDDRDMKVDPYHTTLYVLAMASAVVGGIASFVNHITCTLGKRPGLNK